MAAADVAVALGPRNTRRLRAGAVAVAALAAVVVVVLVTRPSNQAGPGSPASSTKVPGHAPVPVLGRLSYGMTKAQVLHAVGRPTITIGACWQYNENLKIRGGADTLNAERVCFLGGRYSYDHSKTDGKWH